MKTVFRILKEAKKYKWHLIITVFCLLIMTAAQLVTPSIVKNLTELVENNDPDLASKAIRLALILGAAYLLQCVAQGFRNYLAHVASWNFVSDMRVKLYNHFQALSIDFYHDKQIGQLMSRIISDTANIEMMIAHTVPDFIVNVLIFGGVAVLLFTINVKLALISLIVLPFLAVSSRWFAKKARPKFKEGQEAVGDLSAKLQDNLSGIKEIKLFNQQTKESGDVKKISLKHASSILTALTYGAVYHPGVQFLSSMGTVFIIGYGGYLAAVDGLPISTLIAFIMYLSIFYQPISALARFNEDVQSSLAGADRIFEMLDIKATVKDKPNAFKLVESKGNLEFKDVNFHYNESIPIIKNLNFNVNCGQMIALIGQTGVGKTTIVSLLGRFYDPISGQILIDGHDLRDITMESLHDSMSVVLQDVFLFNGTVEDNIRYGEPKATKEQIEEAARLAHAHEFIEKLENGYETYIGERGLKLSGGQKQRLSIARAILRNRPILILDEATSAVDVETEKLIQQAMDKVMENRTTIIIAHRLSTVKKADTIIVLQDGEIAEQGNHDELVANGGIYANYSNFQISV